MKLFNVFAGYMDDFHFIGVFTKRSDAEAVANTLSYGTVREVETDDLPIPTNPTFKCWKCYYDEEFNKWYIDQSDDYFTMNKVRFYIDPNKNSHFEDGYILATDQEEAKQKMIEYMNGIESHPNRDKVFIQALADKEWTLTTERFFEIAATFEDN